MAREYELIVYTDVWGDGDEWMVNNQMKDDRGTITILEDTSDQDILTYLYETDTLSTDDASVVCLEWMDDTVAEIIQVQDGYPLGRLQAVDSALKKTSNYTCYRCKYFHACGDPERTAPCDGREVVA